ncbi:MAG: hypothetical protein WBL93_08805 [Lutisporaceae bacterium]
MWFDEIMDDCKQALVTANKYKGIFLPILLNLVLAVGISIFMFISMFSILMKYRYAIAYMFRDYYSFMEILPTLLGISLILYLIALIGYSIIEVGSINMYKAALNDTKPSFSHFIEGIKKYLLKVILGKVFLNLLSLLLSPILLVLFLLYFVIAGTLTGGWAILFLSAFILVYFSTWVSIIVIEGTSPFKAIGKSIKLGRKYFKGLFIILLATTLLTSYSVSILGIFAAIFVGWFMAGIVSTCFKLVLMLIYYRNKENIE